MATKPPVIKESAWYAGKEARKLSYVVVLLQEAHVDPKNIPKGQALFALATPYEQAGYTSRDIDRWVADCDPPTKPSWDPVECFRQKARAALRPKPGLGVRLAAIGTFAFLAGFALSRRRR